MLTLSTPPASPELTGSRARRRVEANRRVLDGERTSMEQRPAAGAYDVQDVKAARRWFLRFLAIEGIVLLLSAVFLAISACARSDIELAAKPIAGSCASMNAVKSRVAGNLLPPNDDAQFEIYVQTPQGTTLEATTLIPGVADLDSSLVDPVVEAAVEPDLDRAARRGVAPADITGTLGILIGGVEASTFEHDGDQDPVVVRGAEQYRDAPSALSAIASVVVGGQTLSLLLTLLAIPVISTWFDDLSLAGRRALHALRRHQPVLDRGAGEFGLADLSPETP